MPILFHINTSLLLRKPLSLVLYTLISSFFGKKQSNEVSICAEKQTIILSALRFVILMKKHDSAHIIAIDCQSQLGTESLKINLKRAH